VMVTKAAIHPLIGVQLHKWSDRRETSHDFAALSSVLLFKKCFNL
jgi:hypothetical protein